VFALLDFADCIIEQGLHVDVAIANRSALPILCFISDCGESRSFLHKRELTCFAMFADEYSLVDCNDDCHEPEHSSNDLDVDAEAFGRLLRRLCDRGGASGLCCLCVLWFAVLYGEVLLSTV
jgi:hypothetical protein